MTIEQLRAWLDEQPHHPEARVTELGWGPRRVGFLSPSNIIPGNVEVVYRGSRKRKRTTVRQQHLDQGMLEIKVGGRYRPVDEVAR